MSRRRIQGSKTENIRKISKTGQYTYYVTIPKSYIEQLGWRERQRVIVELEKDRIVVRDE